MQRNPRNSAWTGQGGPTGFIVLTDAALTIRGKVFPLAGTTQLGIRHRIEGVPEVTPTGRKRARPKGEPDNHPSGASPVKDNGIGGRDRDTEDRERRAGGGTRGGDVIPDGGAVTMLKPGKRKRPEAEGELGKIEGFSGEGKSKRGSGGGRDGRGKGALQTHKGSARRRQEANERDTDADGESDSEVDSKPDSETSDDDLDALTKELDGIGSGDGVDSGSDDEGGRDSDDDGEDDGKNSSSNHSSTAAPNTEGKQKEGIKEGDGGQDSQSSDSDASSDSIGVAALEFEEFLGTIKGDIGRGDGGLTVHAGGTGAEGAENDEVKEDSEEGFLEASPLAEAGGVSRDGAVPQDHAEVLAQTPVVGRSLRGQAVFPSGEGGSLTSATSSDEGRSEGKREKGRLRKVVAAAFERDCETLPSDDDGGGGGGSDRDADDTSDIDEGNGEEGGEEEKTEERELEEEEVGSDLERDLDDMLREPRQNNATPNVDQSSAAGATESSDSDESSDSNGGAALAFEQFMDTIKGGVGGERGSLMDAEVGGERGSLMDAEGTAVEVSENVEVEAEDEERSLEVSPLLGTGGLARSRAMPQDDGEVLAPKPSVGELLRGEALSPSREGSGSTSGVDASSSDEGPSQGELGKGRERGMVAASERDCRPHSRDDDIDGGGRGGSGSDSVGGRGGDDADDAGGMGENKEGKKEEEKGEERELEEEVGSDLERDSDGILGRPGQNNVTSNGVIDVPPTVDVIESSDSEESSDSIGAAAMEFEQFLGTFKNGVGRGGEGVRMDAEGTGKEDADNDEGLLEAPSLAGTENLVLAGTMPPGDCEVLAQQPTVGELLRGEAFPPTREGSSSTSRVDVLSSEEGPSEGMLGEEEERNMEAAFERDCRSHFSDDDHGGGRSGGGGGDADSGGDMGEDEDQEEEKMGEREPGAKEVGSDVGRDFDGMFGEPGHNSVTPNDVIDQSPAADAIESSDSDESSDSVGSAALNFIQFLDTIKDRVGGEGGSNIDPEGTAVEGSGNNEVDPDHKEELVETPPLAGAGGFAGDGAVSRDGGEVLAQNPVVGRLLHGQAVTSSGEGGSSTSGVLSSRPSDGKLEKERERRVAAVASKRNSRPREHGSGGSGGGGGAANNAGDMTEAEEGEEEIGEEEEKEMGSGLVQGFDGILGEPRNSSVVPNDRVDQSPAADASESSDSDEASDSIGSAALEFEQFLDTIKGRVGGEGGSNIDAEGAAVEESECDKVDAGDEGAALGVPPLERARDLAHDGVPPQGDGKVLAQKPVAGELMHSQALTPSGDESGAASAADPSPSDEGPNEGELEKLQAGGVAVAAAAAEHDYEPHSSDDDADGRGGGDVCAGGMEEEKLAKEEEGEEEEEDVGPDSESDFDDTLKEPRHKSVTSAVNSTEFSDSDQSSDSIGAAALAFEQFLDTIKGGIGGEGGAILNAEGVDDYQSEAANKTKLLEASPLEGAGALAHDVVLAQGDGEVPAQEPVVVDDLVHGQALARSREVAGAVSPADASMRDEGPRKGELEKGRTGGAVAAATERDCEPHSSDGSGGGCYADAGDMGEGEEGEEEAGSGFERELNGILEEPRRNSVASAGPVDRSSAADTMGSSDSEESSDSIGAAAVEFEQFLGTIKSGVGGNGELDMNAQGVDNDEMETDGKETTLEASPLEGARYPASDEGLPQGDGELRAPKPVVEDSVHGQVFTPSWEEGGAASSREASSCREGPSEGELEKRRASGVAVAVTERDCESHCSDDDAGNTEEEEVGSNLEEEDVGSDLERGFDDILEEPKQNSVTSDDVVDQSPAANTTETARSPLQMGVAVSHPLPEVDGGEVEERRVGDRSSESSESEDSDSASEEQSDDDQAIKGFEDFLSGL